MYVPTIPIIEWSFLLRWRRVVSSLVTQYHIPLYKPNVPPNRITNFTASSKIETCNKIPTPNITFLGSLTLN